MAYHNIICLEAEWQFRYEKEDKKFSLNTQPLLHCGKNGAYPPTQNGDTRSLVRPFSRNGSAKILTFSSQ